MSFKAEQVNTFGTMPRRLFFMDAVMKGLPVKVYHCFVDDHATFSARLLALFTVAQAHGPEMDRAETVTLLNDLCIMAPGALVDPSLVKSLISQWILVPNFLSSSRQFEKTFFIKSCLVHLISSGLYKKWCQKPANRLITELPS
jgi:hypothetical protein